MRRFRAEAYSSAFAFIDFGVVSEYELNNDYLTTESSEFTVAKVMTPEVGGYLILKEGASQIYAGIVESFTVEEGRTVITCAPLTVLLDYDVFLNYSVLKSVTIEQAIADTLTATYAGSDSEQNLPGFSATYTAVNSDPEFTSEEINNLYDFCIDALKRYLVTVTFAVDVPNATITATVGHINTASQWKVKVSVADVIDYEISVDSQKDSLNKIKYFDKADYTNTVTYYLHTDGTIDTDSSSNRITPVVYTEKTSEATTFDGVSFTFQQTALSDAKQSMGLSEYDNEIVLTVKEDSKLIEVGDIGQIYIIYDENGTQYKSILTGTRYTSDSPPELVFGMIRTALTSKINK